MTSAVKPVIRILPDICGCVARRGELICSDEHNFFCPPIRRRHRDRPETGAREIEFHQLFQADLHRPVPLRKIICFVISESMVSWSRSATRHEGRTRRHERGAECSGREMCRKTCGAFADGEVVWSWRAHAGAKLSQCSKGFAKATVANAGSPRRARISRKTTAQGRPVITACTCGHRALAQISLRGGSGCMRPPGLPCALRLSGGTTTMQSSGAKRAARMRNVVTVCRSLNKA